MASVPLPEPWLQPVENKTVHENTPSQTPTQRVKVPPQFYSGLPETLDYMRLDAAAAWK
jgi:hypothetical protein